MNIGVILTKDKKEGGAFQYSLAISSLLERNNSREYNFIFFTTVKDNVRVLEKYNLHFHYLYWSNIDRCLSLILNSKLLSGILAKLKINLEPKIDRVLRKYNIDLIYFLNPSDLALATNKYNYIFTVWDLCFLEHMEFPEVRVYGEFERRDELYRLALRKSIRVITDSEAAKRNIIQRYNIDETRVLALPFLPSNVINISKNTHGEHDIDVKEKYNLKDKYIFYPAQFWPHKNHIYILEGLKLLKEKYKIPVSAVFSGSDKGNLQFVLKKAKEFGLENQIHCIGFVDDSELAYLYAQALALVMPTYFGPTNIPPLEAFMMNCPVLYSDLPGLREQAKDAALFLDLRDPESMCRQLLKVIEKSPEISTLTANGKRKIESIMLMQKNYIEELKAVLDDYSLKLKTWK